LKEEKAKKLAAEYEEAAGEIRRVNQTRAADKTRLVKKTGHLSVEIMLKIDRALKLQYDLS